MELWGIGTRPMALGGALLLGMGLSCVNIGHFPCERDSQCELGGQQGRCFDPGYCALPDGGCDSGYRFHAGSVPDDLGGRCVEVQVESSTSTDSTTGPEPERESQTGGVTTTGDSSESGDGSSSTGSMCGDRPCACAASIAVGISSNCATRFDGRVVCWGSGGWAELGDGQVSELALVPQEAELPEALFFTVVRAGNHHMCAHAEDGTVLCWGRNSNREIDPDSSLSSLAPVMPPIEAPLGVIGMGPQHTCMSSSDGPELRCLGNNSYSKLGGDENPSDTAIPIAMPVEGMSLGRDHSCAMANGQVWCWGRNTVGQVGDPMVDGSTPDPTAVGLDGDAQLISGGRDHTCAVQEAMDSVVCWGRNTAGQVGDGTQTNRGLPTPLKDPLPAEVRDLDGRYDSTCALLEDDTLWCWGGTNGDDLGTASQPGAEVREPMQVEVINDLPEDLVEIGVGQRHMCGRAESGRLWCWGQGYNGQIGPSGEGQQFAMAEIDLGCPPGVGN